MARHRPWRLHVHARLQVRALVAVPPNQNGATTWKLDNSSRRYPMALGAAVTERSMVDVARPSDQKQARWSGTAPEAPTATSDSKLEH